jgi:glycosyltransferase involved in cell wall biosynthesis
MSPNLRIAFVTPAWPASRTQNGIATYVDAMRRGLADLGVASAAIAWDCEPGGDPDVLAHARGRALPWRLRLRTALLARLPGGRGLGPVVADGIAEAARTLDRRAPLSAIEIEESFGIPALLADRAPAPVVVRLHGPWFLTGAASGAALDTGFHRRVAAEWRGMQRAAAVIAPTRALLAAVEQRHGAPLPRAVVLPNPGPAPTPTPLWRRDGPRRIAHIGRFERLKGSDVVLAAFATLARRAPDVHLDLVGPDLGMRGDDGEQVDFPRYLARLGLDADVTRRIRWHGPLPPAAVAAVRRDARLVVVASRYETFPMTVLEAMADGCPVVATRVGGIPEMVADEREACLVPPGDAAALAAAWQRLLAAPDAAVRLGDGGRARFLAEFAPTAVARRVADFYAERFGRRG